MHIYLAASWPQRKRMRDVAEHLQALGIMTTSRWIYSESESGMGPAEIAEGQKKAVSGAIRDFQDINAAHRVAVFTDVPSSTGGFHVEFGYALSREKPIDIVGPALNVFYALRGPGIRHFPDATAWFDQLHADKEKS